MRVFSFLVSLLIASATAAAAPGDKQSVAIPMLVSSSAATDLALDSNKTLDEFDVTGLDYVTFGIDYTNSAATAVTMTCTASFASAGTDFAIQVFTYSGATAASDAHTWSQAVSGDEVWVWTVNVLAYRFMQCTFAGTSADASDTITVVAYGAND